MIFLIRLCVALVISACTICTWNVNCNATTPCVRKARMVAKHFFKTVPSKEYPKIATDPLNLLQAAKDSLHCLCAYEAKNSRIADPDNFSELVSLAAVKKTLKFVIATIEQDKNKKHFRICDPLFIKKNFKCLQWNADWKTAQCNAVKMPHDGKIRLTTYGVFEVKGSHKKTADFPCGLYKLSDFSIRTKYTKHQVLSGVLEKKANRAKSKALAWVSRQSIEDALMHGTVLVNFADGGRKILNVDQHNGVAYDKKQKNILAQKRYWFFKEIKGSKRSTQERINRMRSRKGVIFAGDLDNLGIGKLIALTYQNPQSKKQEMRLGILADTGGAFVSNLYQLDLFGGIFKDHSQLRKHLKTLPSFTRAAILYKT